MFKINPPPIDAKASNKPASVRRRRAAALAATALASAPAPLAAAENYEFRIEGAPAELAERLAQISQLALEKRRYPTAAAVRRAGQQDARAIENALRSSGYYRASARLELGESDEPDGKLSATVRADPGPLFAINEHIVVFLDDGPEDRPRGAGALGLDLAPDSSGAALAAAGTRLIEAYWNAGYPQARSVSRRVEVLPPDETGAARARAIYEVESGPRARFGELEVSGARRTSETFLGKLTEWREGELFDRAKLIAYQDRLIATNIFESVDVAPGVLDEGGAAPVIVDLEERKPRTFGVGVSFSTVEGLGGRLFLEYRNVLGAGETARFDIAATEIAQEAQLTFNKPFPRLPGEAFASVGFTNETTAAFDARTVSASAGLAKRWLDGRLQTRAGLGFETTRLETADTDERNYFVSLPLSVIWDNEDDPLALTRGARASVSLTPFVGSAAFTQVDIAARSRRNFGENDKYTFAGRIRLGSVFGASFENIPQNRRLFSGGGSSVRGFDFQAVGPLDDDGAPTGGRSVIEAALEARMKVAANIQAAAFIDAGSVSERAAWDFGGDYFVGVGGGARYLSPIGPLRVDFALPLERRSSDRAWQLYISIGQPF